MGAEPQMTHNGHCSQGAPETQDLFAFAPLNLCGVMSNLRQPQAKVAMSLEAWKAGRASHQADLDSDRRHTLGSIMPLKMFAL